MSSVGLYLQKVTADAPTPQQWKAAYGLIETELARHQLEPSYYTISSFDDDGKQRKYGSATHRKKLEKGFHNVDIIGFSVTRPDSNSPAFDSVADVSMSYMGDGMDQLELILLVNEQLCSLNTLIFDDTLRAFCVFTDWDFGWALTRDKERGAQMYLNGSGSSSYAPEDERRVKLWHEMWQYPKERISRLRDVFDYNIVNEIQLSFPIGQGTLEDFIVDNAQSKLEKLTNSLSLWKVERGKSEEVRSMLLGTGLIISD